MDDPDSICSIDTDGIKKIGELKPELVGKKLGKMKYEGSFKLFTSIAPKVYSGIGYDLEMTSKCKGLKKGMSF
jgi:hypothetical protein